MEHLGDGTGSHLDLTTFPSRLSELRTNDLTSVPAASIRSNISSAKAMLQALEVEMLLITQTLQKLSEKRTKIIRTIDENESLLAPIRRLPREVLCEIFSSAIRPSNGIHPVGSWAEEHLMSREPFALSSVCTYWNHIMTTTPSLWSHFFLNIDSNLWPTNAEKLARQYLSSSGPMWLHLLFVQERRLRPGKRADVRQSLIRLICGASDRIRSLSVRISQDPFAGTLDTPFQTRNLRNVHIHYIFGEQQRSESFSWISNRNELHSLRLDGATVCDPLKEKLALQWKATQVSTAEYSLDQSCEVLSAFAGHVEHAVLDFMVHVIVPDSPPLPILRMPKLRQLAIEFAKFTGSSDFSCVDPVPYLFDTINTPSLRILQLHYEDFVGEQRVWPRTSFEGYVSRSNIAPTLQVLQIMSKFITGDDIAHIVGLLPNLQCLFLGPSHSNVNGDIIVNSALLRHLIPRSGIPPVLPHLQRLRISLPFSDSEKTGFPDQDDWFEALADLVEIRSSSVMSTCGQLKALQVWTHESIHRSENAVIRTSLNRLAACRSHGLILCSLCVFLSSVMLSANFLGGCRLPEDLVGSSDHDSFHDWIVAEDFTEYWK
jgi:hypothetical protein